ncbi:RHS repeat domain-containing protein [Vibrio sp. 10N.261.51.F12]|uniref:RHS repeat domain-containing protein n=1 Tax=Vibrio sp. 10N.261.51.F12 TaxID=3229679 RepID=UPI00354AE41C
MKQRNSQGFVQLNILVSVCLVISLFINSDVVIAKSLPSGIDVMSLNKVNDLKEQNIQKKSLEKQIVDKIESLDDARAYLSQFIDGKYKHDVLSLTFPVISRISYSYQNRKRSDIQEQNYAYDKQGRLAQKRSRFGFSKTTVESYKYDASDELLTRSIVKNGRPMSVMTYQYNQDGNIAKETEDYPNGSKVARSFEYSKSGQLIASSLNVDGIQVEYYIHHYDSLGNKSKSEKYSQVGLIGTRIDTINYLYDTSNTLIKVSSYGEVVVDDQVLSGQKSEWYYTYDDNNRLIEERHVYESRNIQGSEPVHRSMTINYYIWKLNGLLFEERHMSLGEYNSQNLISTIKYQYVDIQLNDLL